MKKSISEAPESNAGDNFHVLWTVKKSFDLLNFHEDGLKAITIEGIAPKNRLKLDPFGNQLLGVDIAEYFGGEDFNDAKKIVVSQLKYSTRRINKDWTFSELYKGKKSKSTDGSTLHRLSQIYKTFLDRFGRDLVLRKLSLKLVSNRNFNKVQKQIILDVQDFLKNKKSSTYSKTIHNHFPKFQTRLKKLQQVTKLKSAEFTDFLRLIDFEDCGTDSSYHQELEIIGALNNLGIQNLGQNDSLFRMIWRKMLPAAIAAGENKITEIDLLYRLNISKERLFPVIQSFEEIRNLVGRKQVQPLIDKILKNNTGYPICLHGGAGIGKSTISQLIKQKFPKDSEVILFDCYGAGTYLNSSDSRHLHKEAILQISNEMAKKIGSPFLLSTESESYLLVREFKNRVENAIKILRKRKPDSLLVLIIDAADNSVTAAQKNQTTSFIHDLVNETYAEGFRLIVTSRSHRVLALNLPKQCISIPLDPFDFEETRTHLTFYFPQSTKKEIQDFNQLTNGIPRVQTYALNLKREGIQEVINYLRPNGKKVEDLIEERIIESEKKLGNKGTEIISKFFTTLITLPRPVPISYISTVSGLDEEILLDLSTDIWHGLVLNNNSFSFRDEDFENYIRGKYYPGKGLYVKIANLFLNKANEDEYASINLGIALYEAKYEEKLKSIILNEEFKVLPVDPIRKKEVYIERTKLAMKVSSHEEDRLTFFKLAFVAADAAKTDVALNNLLLQNVDLVTSFGESDSLQRLHLQSEKKSWSGSFYYQLAAIYSRKSNSIERAKNFLKTAEKWVDWWQGQKETREDRDFHITNKDIAYGAEAYLRLFGSKVAFEWLKRWSPKRSVFQATDYLMDNVLKYSDEKQILKWLAPLIFPIHIKLIILDKIQFVKFGPFDLNEMAESILRVLSNNVKFKRYFFPKILSFCELLIDFNPSQKEKVLKILAYINIELSSHVPSLIDNEYIDTNDKVIIDSFFRKRSLEAALINIPLKLEDIYPEKFKEKKQEGDYEMRRFRSEEKRNFDRFYTHAISIYRLRLDALMNNDEKNLESRFQAICERIKKDWEFKYYDKYSVHYKLNFLALILVEVLPFLEVKRGYRLVETIINSFEVKNQDVILLRIALASKVSLFKGLHESTYKILDEIDSLLQKSAFTSGEMINYYIQSSRIIRGIDKQTSKYYFDKAVDAVSEIDIEAQDQIKCLYNLSEFGIPRENPQLAFEFSRFVEYCYSRLRGYDHFPLTEGIKGISYLDSATSFAIICRWGHRYVANITEEIIPILKIALEKDFITPTICSAMLPLNIYYWKSYVDLIKVLLNKYDATKNNEQKNSLIKNVLRDIQINSPSYEKKETVAAIYETIKDGRFLTSDVVQNFERYNQFISDLYSEKNEESSREQTNLNRQKNNKNYNKKLCIKNVDINSVSSINKALRIIRSNGNDEYHLIQPEISGFLNELKNSCTPQNYVSHLNALIEINTDLISFYALEKALTERLKVWSFHPLVKKWKIQNFSKVLKMWFSNFSFGDEIYYDSIIEFADIFSITNSDLAKIIFKILPERIDELSATAIYQTIAFLKSYLNQEENESLISWVLARWNSKIKDDFADGLWSEKHIPPNTQNEVIAQTIRFILGHPDKRIRWRGVHALRRIVNSGDINILETLLKLQNTHNCYPFQHEEYMYFWISAKLYLWICVERLSKENSKKISLLKSLLYQEVKSKNLPHTLIIYFIKQTCLNLNENNSSLFSKDEISIINDLLISKLALAREINKEIEQKKHDEYSFNFDPIDTLPYWYKPLGNCFGISDQNIANLVDKYIKEEWGYSGDIHKDDHVNVKYSYSLISNRKGSLPTVENLRKYFEYHGMYCVAGNLLEKKPLLQANTWDSWKYWIESTELNWNHSWLSDLRNSIPLDRKFWIPEYDKFDKNWKNNIDEKIYDDIIKLYSDNEINTIIPYGEYSRYFGKNSETITINSAIVSLKTAESLLRILQTSKSYYDYNIPLVNSDSEIKENDFKLLGWLERITSGKDTIEKNDPFAIELCKSYVLFGKKVKKHFDIKYSQNLKKAYLNEKKISTYQIWSNVTDKRSYDHFESEGYILNVDTKFILEFLKKENVCLIVECNINRRLEDYTRDDKKNNTKIYLIKPNGEIKTIRGRNYKIG